MMESLLMFIGGTIAVLIAALFYVFRSWSAIIHFFKIQKGAVKGIVLVLGIFAAVAIGGYAFGEVYAYTGLDSTKKPSPMCREGNNDDRLTSHVGFGWSFYQSKDKRFKTTLKYTHHSCAFNDDVRSYDAAGIELRYTIID